MTTAWICRAMGPSGLLFVLGCPVADQRILLEPPSPLCFVPESVDGECEVRAGTKTLCFRGRLEGLVYCIDAPSKEVFCPAEPAKIFVDCESHSGDLSQNQWVLLRSSPLCFVSQRVGQNCEAHLSTERVCLEGDGGASACLVVASMEVLCQETPPQEYLICVEEGDIVSP
jgi:hypothetical protein